MLTGTLPLAVMLQTDLRGMGRAEQTRQLLSLTGIAESERMLAHGLRYRTVSFCLRTQKYYCLTLATAFSLKKKAVPARKY